jgi:hypothetical protein
MSLLDSPRIFHWLAPAFACAGVFHGAALVWPHIAEPVPAWFHALFVVVNGALAVGVVKRPRGFLPVYVVYTLQQLIEHGVRGVTVWQDEQRLDWASLASILFVPFVLFLLLREARREARTQGTLPLAD